MTDNQIALLRFPAFFIDITLIMAPLFIFKPNLEIEWVMLGYIPVMFFLYWIFNINVGKRIFKLKVVDAVTLEKATVFQLFKRSILFSLVVSFNVAFIIPLFVSKKHQSFHDMLAKTVVVRES